MKVKINGVHAASSFIIINSSPDVRLADLNESAQESEDLVAQGRVRSGALVDDQVDRFKQHCVVRVGLVHLLLRK